MHSPVVQLLGQLIRIPSVNPDSCPGAAHTGEAAMADYVAQLLREMGAEVVLEEVKPDRPNVIGRFPSGCPGKPKVLLGPHLDTVSIDGMTIDPFGGEVRDGRVWGRGASDTKGTMAAMLIALGEIGAARLANLGAEVSFVGFMGEENSQPGSRHFAQHHPDYAFALIGEPTNRDVVHTTKGCGWVKLQACGVAAHGATPEAGENAILKMAALLAKVDGVLRPRLAEFSHPVLGASTVNVGLIKGGSLPNIVADHCEASLDIRATPSLVDYGVDRVVAEFLAGSDVSYTMPLAWPAMDVPLDNPYVAKLLALGAKPVGAPWFCDAAHLAAVGVPSVAAGPGSIAQAHTKDEWISIEELELGVAFYRDFLLSL